MKISHPRSILFAVAALFFFGCSGSKPQYEPCKEMVAESDGIRDTEKRLSKVEDQIKKYRSAGDSSGLNSALRSREALLEKKKLAQFAADRTRADCNPSIFQQPPPVDQTKYHEDRQFGK